MAALALTDMIDVHPSCVVVVVDVHTALWSLRQQFGTEEFLKLEEVSSLVTVYCNTIALMHRRNSIFVIFHNSGTKWYIVLSSVSLTIIKITSLHFTSLHFHFHFHFTSLHFTSLHFTSLSTEGKRVVYPSYIVSTSQQPTKKPLADAVQEAFDEEIAKILQQPADVPTPSSSSSSSVPSSEKEARFGLSQALSQALCIVNKRLLSYPKLQTRVCLIQLTKDQSRTYTPIMNCIFSAQKLGTIVDCLNLGRAQSSFLQQAAHLTGKIHLFLCPLYSLIHPLFNSLIWTNASCRWSILVRCGGSKKCTSNTADSLCCI